MTAILFLDTETTGLSLQDDIWEFAAIRREPDGRETEHHLFIEHDPAKCERLPLAFLRDHHARFPGASTRGCPGRGAGVVSRAHAAGYIAVLAEDRPHVVGAVPNFDTERLSLLLDRHGQKWGGHYHLIDVENLAVGYLAGRLEAVRSEIDSSATEPAIALPWNSDTISRAVGVEPPGEGERHTAMGDARWARAIYDRVMGCAP